MTSACEKPGGISSTWCETRTIADGRGSAASTARSAMSVSRAPRSRLAAGSSSSSRSGSGISARAIEVRRRSPADSVPYGMIRDALEPEPVEEPPRPRPVVIRVDVPPRLGRGVAGGHHDRRPASGRRGGRLDGAPGRPDASSMLARVDPAVAPDRGRRRCPRSATAPGRSSTAASSCPTRSGR